MATLLSQAANAINIGNLTEAQLVLQQAGQLPVQSTELRLLENKLTAAQRDAEIKRQRQQAQSEATLAREKLAAQQFDLATEHAKRALALDPLNPAMLRLRESIEPARKAHLLEQRARADQPLTAFRELLAGTDWQEADARALLNEASRIAEDHPALPALRLQLHQALHLRAKDNADILLRRAASEPDAIRVQTLREAEQILPEYPPTMRAFADFFHKQMMQHIIDGNNDAARLSAAQGLSYDRENRYELEFKYEAMLACDCEDGDYGGWSLFHPNSQTTLPLAGQHRLTADVWLLKHEAGLTMPLDLTPGEDRRIALPTVAPRTTIGGTTVVPVLIDSNLLYVGEREITGAEYVGFLNDPSIRERIDNRRTAGLMYAPRAAIADEQGLWPREPGLFRRAGGFQPTAQQRRQPVAGVSYEDVQAYIAWRRQRDGVAWRLPTAKEWAAAAGENPRSPYPTGATIDLTTVVSGQFQGGGNLPAAGSAPTDRTATGLFDMAGSVSEWTATPTPATAPARRLVGGHWQALDTHLFRISYQPGADERIILPYLGFRLVVDIENGQLNKNAVVSNCLL